MGVFTGMKMRVLEWADLKSERLGEHIGSKFGIQVYVGNGKSVTGWAHLSDDGEVLFFGTREEA